jgi:hypothetical protein
LLFRHRGGVRPEEGKSIESIVEEDIIQLPGLGLLDCLSRLLEALQREQAIDEVQVWCSVIRG